MNLKLKREFLWSDKKTIEELISNPIGYYLYTFSIIEVDGRVIPFEHIPRQKVFNEVFYQAIKVVYENYDINFDDMILEIKSNLGSISNTGAVLKLMVCLLKFQKEQSDVTNLFYSKLQHFLNTRHRPISFSFRRIDNYIKFCTASNRGIYAELHPQPCEADEIEGLSIDWSDMTQGFSEAAIKKILNLWESRKQQGKILRLIEHAYYENTYNFLCCWATDAVDSSYFEKKKQYIGAYEGLDTSKICHDKNEAFQTKQTARIAVLEDRIKNLESENERLKSELNSSKPLQQRERAFTLTMIVDYCKKKSGSEAVTQIVAMLYKFLRHGTDEEHELVDSIEEGFVNRKYGNQYYAPVGQVLEHVEKVENKVDNNGKRQKKRN